MNSSCLSRSWDLFYQCYNTFPIDRTNVETLYIICNTTNNLFQQQQERFYSIIKSYTAVNCTMEILYLDQYTLWNYLEYMSITYANLKDISSISFNRSLSLSLPILYSIKMLNLSHNSIRVINRTFSYYFPSLEKLDLSYNHMIHIKKKTFSNLTYLKELYLNNNYLKHILPNIFPHHSLYLINLNMNYWHCSCKNILTLSISRPIPICYRPIEFQNQNVSNIALQCSLQTKVNILITVSIHRKQNLTCALSPIINEWRNKLNKNITLLSAWNIEQGHPVSLDHLPTLSSKSDEHLICFNFQSSHPGSIDTIISLSSIASPNSSLSSTNLTNLMKLNSTYEPSTTTLTITTSSKLSPFFLWLLNASKSILPKYFQSSNKHVLIAWLILLLIALFIFIFLIYFTYRRKTVYEHKRSYSTIHLNTNHHSHHRTLFDTRFTCKDHKCLCQHRRCYRSTKSEILNLLEKQSNFVQPSFIEPYQLRYAKIKRISPTKKSDNNNLTE